MKYIVSRRRGGRKRSQRLSKPSGSGCHRQLSGAEPSPVPWPGRPASGAPFPLRGGLGCSSKAESLDHLARAGILRFKRGISERLRPSKPQPRSALACRRCGGAPAGPGTGTTRDAGAAAAPSDIRRPGGVPVTRPRSATFVPAPGRGREEPPPRVVPAREATTAPRSPGPARGAPADPGPRPAPGRPAAAPLRRRRG